MHFLQTQDLQQLTDAPQTFKGPKLPKNVPTAQNIAKKTPQIHDDQPTAPAF